MRKDDIAKKHPIEKVVFCTVEPKKLFFTSVTWNQTFYRNFAIHSLFDDDRGFAHVKLVPDYSKSQIFVQKFNFDKTPTFWQVFHPNFFWQFFSWSQSCQQLKSPKPQHFHEFFTQKKDNFLGKTKLNFWILRFRTVCEGRPRSLILCAPILVISSMILIIAK